MSKKFEIPEEFMSRLDKGITTEYTHDFLSPYAPYFKHTYPVVVVIVTEYLQSVLDAMLKENLQTSTKVVLINKFLGKADNTVSNQVSTFDDKGYRSAEQFASYFLDRVSEIYVELLKEIAPASKGADAMKNNAMPRMTATYRLVHRILAGLTTRDKMILGEYVNIIAKHIVDMLQVLKIDDAYHVQNNMQTNKALNWFVEKASAYIEQLSGNITPYNVKDVLTDVVIELIRICTRAIDQAETSKNSISAAHINGGLADLKNITIKPNSQSIPPEIAKIFGKPPQDFICNDRSSENTMSNVLPDFTQEIVETTNKAIVSNSNILVTATVSKVKEDMRKAAKQGLTSCKTAIYMDAYLRKDTIIATIKSELKVDCTVEPEADTRSMNAADGYILTSWDKYVTNAIK